MKIDHEMTSCKVAEVSTLQNEVVESFLQDHYENFGCDLESFREATEFFSQNTYSIDVIPMECSVLTVCNEDRFQKKGMYAFHVWNVSTLEDFSRMLARERGPVIAHIPIGDIPENIFREMEDTTQMCVLINGGTYVVSELAIPTLTTKVGIGGNTTINSHTFLRNCHLAEGWFDSVGKTHIIYREENGVRKIFAFMGSRYQDNFQSCMTAILDSIQDEAVLGDMIVRSWHQDHRFTKIHVEFPKAAEDIAEAYPELDKEFVPGIELQTSDVGASSLTARGILRVGRSNIVFGEVGIPHSTCDMDKLNKKIDEKIFSNVRTLPEVLSNQFESILDYAVVDLSTEEGQKKNLERFESIITEVVKPSLKKILGDLRINELIEACMAEINPSLPYTYYDCSMYILEIPERIKGLEQYSQDFMKKAVGQAPYRVTEIMKRKKISLS